MQSNASCLAEACGREAFAGAPVPLCEGHLDLARDWADGALGTTDVMPTPCAACGSRLGLRFASGTVCAVCEWRVGDVPDGELTRPRVDVVYYIRFDDRIKIGTTANPRQRLGRLWHDDLLGFERGDRSLEQARHEQFARQRLGRTEWFELDLELAAHVESVADGQLDPWATYARWVSEALALRL